MKAADTALCILGSMQTYQGRAAAHRENAEKGRGQQNAAAVGLGSARTRAHQDTGPTPAPEAPNEPYLPTQNLPHAAGIRGRDEVTKRALPWSHLAFGAGGSPDHVARGLALPEAAHGLVVAHHRGRAAGRRTLALGMSRLAPASTRTRMATVLLEAMA